MLFTNKCSSRIIFTLPMQASQIMILSLCKLLNLYILAGQKPKCFIMLAGPNILIYLANYFFLNKFLFTLLWNLMLIFVHFNFNFSHVSDIVQTDYLSIIDIFDTDHQQYTYLLMCSILLIMIIFTHNNNIFFHSMPSTKMFTMRAGQMPTYFICIITNSILP